MVKTLPYFDTRASINGSGFSVLYADISWNVSPIKGNPMLPGGRRIFRREAVVVRKRKKMIVERETVKSREREKSSIVIIPVGCNSGCIVVIVRWKSLVFSLTHLVCVG